MTPVAPVLSAVDGEANILETAFVLGAVVPEASTRPLVFVRGVVGLVGDTHPNALARSVAGAVSRGVQRTDDQLARATIVQPCQRYTVSLVAISPKSAVAESTIYNSLPHSASLPVGFDSR
jgi:hypothetical protein